MKSLITAIVITVVIVGGGFYSSHKIDSLTEELTIDSEAMLTAIVKEDYVSAGDRLDAIDRRLEDKRILLGSVFDHAVLEKIEMYMTQMKAYVSQEEKLPSLSAGTSLDKLFKDLPNDYRLRPENIF